MARSFWGSFDDHAADEVWVGHTHEDGLIWGEVAPESELHRTRRELRVLRSRVRVLTAWVLVLVAACAFLVGLAGLLVALANP